MTYNQTTIEEGLDLILGHFLVCSGVNIPRSKEISLWPRTISTKATEGRQMLVYDKTEALARFAQSNYQDCRMSAYPPNVLENPFRVQSYVGLTQVTPIDIIIMMDLDRNNFKTDRGLQMALTRTLNNIKEKLDAIPTVLWSGRGYHIIQPLNSNGIILENIKEYEDINNISLRFLRFAESYLSLKKSDLQHNTTVSFNNCMPRIPGSINSKNGQEVKVIQKWNGIRPEINYLLAGFTRYIINEKYRELLKAQKRDKIQPTNFNASNNEINWIEKLLQTPLADHRKYCVWRILTPYLLNKRKLSSQVAFEIIQNWLQQCNKLRRLDFDLRYRVNDSIERAVSRYMPIAYEKLKEENPELYQIIVSEF
jgi:Primase X